MALVTMSEERMARQISAIVGFPAFTTIVSGNMVEQSKPHPEAYLLAADVLGVDPVHCVAIEDSLPGVAAAVASGAVVVAVPHMVPIEPSEHYTRLDTLTGTTLAFLTELYGSRRPSTPSTPTTPKDATPA
jgi:beta-phosphoglucomutase-like phosphatase (HAD superfamily)